MIVFTGGGLAAATGFGTKARAALDGRAGVTRRAVGVATNDAKLDLLVESNGRERVGAGSVENVDTFGGWNGAGATRRTSPLIELDTDENADCLLKPFGGATDVFATTGTTIFGGRIGIGVNDPELPRTTTTGESGVGVGPAGTATVLGMICTDEVRKGVGRARVVVCGNGLTVVRRVVIGGRGVVVLGVVFVVCLVVVVVGLALVVVVVG